MTPIRSSPRRQRRRTAITRAAAAAAAVVVGLNAITARAASQYWDANGNATGASPGSGVAPGTWGVDSFWNDLADGTGNSNPWTDGNVAVFSAGSDANGAFTVTLSGTQTAAQIVFEEGTVTLSGGQINLGAAGVDVGNLAGALTSVIGSDLVGSLGLTKTGPGVLALRGTANTYTGATSVNGGTLSIVDDTNLGDAANSLALNGGTLRSDANLTIARAVVLGASNGTINTNGFTVTLSGNVTGAGGLTKSSTGTLVLTGTNTYNGVTTFNGGTVEAGPTNLGVNSFVFGGGTLRTAASFNTNRPLAMSAAGTVNTNGFDSTFSGTITGTGSFNKSGDGTLTLTANNAGYTGTINVQAGTLRATDSGVFGVAGTANPTSAVQVSSGATLDVADNVNVPDRVFVSGTGINNNGAIHYAGSGNATFSGGVTLNTSSRVVADSGSLTFTSAAFFNSTNPGEEDLTFAGAGNITVVDSTPNANIAIAGGRVYKEGSGTLIINETNSFTGGVTARGGVLQFNVDTTTNGASANLGAYPSTFKVDAVVLDGGTIRNAGGTNGANFISPNRGIQLTASGGAIDSPTAGVALIYHSNTTDSTSGIIGLASGATSGTLTKVGAGEFRVQGGGTASFGFTQLVAKNGLYRIGSAGTGPQSVETGFGAAPATPTNDAIVLDGGAIGTSLNITLNDNRGITVTANGGTINGSAPATITMPATSQAKLTGSGPLTITGNTGNGFILNAPLSDYSGALTVNGLFNIGSQVNLTVASLSGNSNGRLGVNGQLTFGTDNTNTTFSGAVTAAAATGVVSKTGSGTLTINTNPWANVGPTNINAGTLRYGDSATGLGDNSAVTIAAGATLDMGGNADTIGSLAGAGSVVSGGNVTITGNNASPVTYSGNYAGAGSIAKNGSGTQHLAGSNSFSAVNVAAGVLGVQSNGALGAGAAPLNVSGGSVAFLPTGTGTIAAKVGSLTIASGAKIDLADDKLITTTGVGTLTGSTYDGVTGMIQSGRNGGDWSGSGIVTSLASGNFTTIGVATGQQVKGLSSSSDTAVWAGRTITGSDTLVMYTYGGDANLDGKINVDDYGHIDTSIPLGLSGWFNGDFNYDGKINVDDYGIIDFNIGIQGAPFFTGSSSASGLSGVSAVPEPATIGSITLLSTAMLARRRRRMQ